MKRLLIAALVAVFCYPAFAADITPKNVGRDAVYNQSEPWVWETVTNADTTKEQPVSAGLYHFHVDGTPDNVDLKLQWGKTSGSLKDLDVDQMPDGVRFSSASTGYSSLVCLGTGFADITFLAAGGGSQDVDIWLERLGDCSN